MKPLIELAREAGFSVKDFEPPVITAQHSNGSWVGIGENLERFAELVRGAERQPLTDEQEREAFEEYAIRTICNPVDLQRVRLSGYSSQELNYLWRGWKARAAHDIKEKA